MILINCSSLFSQAISGNNLDINNIKARINSEGSLFWDFSNQMFEVPAGTGRHTIFANALWVGGKDSGGNLRLAGQTYRQTGADFFQGPVDPTNTYGAGYINNWNRVWKINQCDIDAYENWVINSPLGPNPVDSIAMDVIINWPTHNTDGSLLAPFNDINGNGIYEPTAGETPKIKGDQAIFFIYNDVALPHTESGGNTIGLEIQGMAYAYSCPNDSALFNTIFTNYKIINKSNIDLDSVFIGNWTDLDIGVGGDDYIGCDVMRGAYFGYNGDSIDDNAPSGQLPYGANPPAQAVVFLSGPWADANGIDDNANVSPNGLNYGNGISDDEKLGMSKFTSFNYSNTATGFPFTSSDFYNYLSGYWKDGTRWTYGGNGYLTGVDCDYIYPGDSDPLGYGVWVPQLPWDESSASNNPGDRIGLGSFGPFKMQAGEINEIEFAYVYARATTGGNYASVTLLKERIDSVRQKYLSGASLTCGCSSLTGVTEQSNSISLFNIYPNPSNNTINIEFEAVSNQYDLKIIDITGRVVKSSEKINSIKTTLNISDLENGIYLISVFDGKNSITKKIIKQ